MKGKGDKLLGKVARRKDMCRRLRRREELLRKPLEDAGGAQPANTLLLKLDVK